MWATPDGDLLPSGEVKDARRLRQPLDRLAERGMASGEVVIADAYWEGWCGLRPDAVLRADVDIERSLGSGHRDHPARGDNARPVVPFGFAPDLIRLTYHERVIDKASIEV